MDKRILILFMSLAAAVLVYQLIRFLPDGKLHIVFCNVGQGDGAYIRSPKGFDMVVDGGPDNKILSCLSKFMPFFDRHISVVMISHPQKDHYGGITEILKRYKVDYLITNPVKNDIESYRELIRIALQRNIEIKNIYKGDSIKGGDIDFDILWPTFEFVKSEIASSESAQFSRGKSQTLGLSTEDDFNDFAYQMVVTYGNFKALFTGDGDSRIDPYLLSQKLPDIEILKFPHHGSKTALIPEFLDESNPELAVISVGRNTYGHPSEEALNLLQSKGIKYLRTDRSGDIEIVTDGKTWNVRTER